MAEICHCPREFGQCSIYIDDTQEFGLLRFRSRARKISTGNREHWSILIDYLQLIAGLEENRQTWEVSEISRNRLKFGQGTKVPVLL